MTSLIDAWGKNYKNNNEYDNEIKNYYMTMSKPVRDTFESANFECKFCLKNSKLNMFYHNMFIILLGSIIVVNILTIIKNK
jgi:hypothetical protein